MKTQITPLAYQAMRMIAALVTLIVGNQVKINWNSNKPAGMDGHLVIHLPRPKVGDADEIALLLRLAVHESGHVLHTDMTCLSRLSDAELRYFNLVEDPRMEHAHGAQYPGAHVLLAHGLDKFPSLVEAALQSTEPKTERILREIYLLSRGYAAVQPKAAFAQAIALLEPRLHELFTPDQLWSIDLAMASLAKAQSSHDSEEIGKMLAQAMHQPDQQQEQQPQAGQAQGQDQDQDQGQTQDSSADQDEQGQAGDGQPQLQDQQGSDQSQQAQGQQEEGADTGANNPQPSPPQGDDSQAQGDAPQQGEQSQEHAQDGESSPSGQPEQSQPGAQSEAESEASSTESGPHSQSSQDDEQAQADQSGQAAQQEQGSGEQQEAGTPDAASCAQDQPDQSQSSGAEQPDQGPMDLGHLLRQIHREQYGPDDGDSQDSPDASQCAPSAGDMLKVKAVLEMADPEQSARELLEQVEKSLSDPSGGDQDAAELQAEFAQGGSIQSATDVSMSAPRLQGVEAKLVNLIRREFSEQRRKPTGFTNAGTKLAVNRYWRLDAMGDTNVFKKRRVQQGMDCAVSVLLDSSGSMKHDIGIATAAVSALSLAFERISGIKSSVYTFPGHQAQVQKLKDFGDTHRRAEARITSVQADGGTPLGYAMMNVLGELGQQRRLRRILIVVTDGMPDDAHAVKRALYLASELQVEVIGIGINYDITRHLPRSEQINDVTGLPDALFNIFKTKMLDKQTG